MKHASPFLIQLGLYKTKNKCVCICVCVVGGGGPDSLAGLECVVVCGGSDKSWMKVSCPIVSAVWAAAVAAFLVWAMCVYVCPLCCRVFVPSPPPHPWESVTGVPSCAAAAAGLRGWRQAGRVLLPPLRVLWPSMHPVHEISPWPSASGSGAVSEKKAKECGS